MYFQSKVCHLADLSPEELVEHNEHADEWGGYFVVKVRYLYCLATPFLTFWGDFQHPVCLTKTEPYTHGHIYEAEKCSILISMFVQLRAIYTRTFNLKKE